MLAVRLTGPQSLLCKALCTPALDRAGRKRGRCSCQGRGGTHGLRGVPRAGSCRQLTHIVAALCPHVDQKPTESLWRLLSESKFRRGVRHTAPT